METVGLQAVADSYPDELSGGMQQQDAHTIVFISHDLDEAIRIGDRIAIMEGGAVVQIGTPEEIVTNPANEYVRSFFYGVDMCVRSSTPPSPASIRVRV